MPPSQGDVHSCDCSILEQVPVLYPLTGFQNFIRRMNRLKSLLEFLEKAFARRVQTPFEAILDSFEVCCFLTIWDPSILSLLYAGHAAPAGT